MIPWTPWCDRNKIKIDRDTHVDQDSDLPNAAQIPRNKYVDMLRQAGSKTSIVWIIECIEAKEKNRRQYLLFEICGKWLKWFR